MWFKVCMCGLRFVCVVSGLYVRVLVYMCGIWNVFVGFGLDVRVLVCM